MSKAKSCPCRERKPGRTVENHDVEGVADIVEHASQAACNALLGDIQILACARTVMQKLVFYILQIKRSAQKRKLANRRFDIADVVKDKIIGTKLRTIVFAVEIIGNRLPVPPCPVPLLAARHNDG